MSVPTSIPGPWSRLSALAVAGVLAAGSANCARAQAVQGDLIIGFVPNGTVSQGNTTNLEIDLGSAAGFMSAPSGVYTIANLGPDLSSTFGSNWAATTLSFGVIGAETGSSIATPTKSIWASSTDAGGTGSAVVYHSGSSSSYNSAAISKTLALYSGLAGSFGGSSATTLGDIASQTDVFNTSLHLQGLTVTQTTGGAWNFEQGLAIPFSVPGGASQSTFLTPVNSGNSTDLIQIGSSASPARPDIGYFSLNSSGVLTFTDGSGQTGGPAPGNRLVNISTRAFVGTGASVEIAGFVVSGPAGSSEQVLVRAVGPALSQFGVSGALSQPVLALFDSTGNPVAANTGWSTGAYASDIASAFATTGAFALPSGSADSALLVNLSPGAYTAQITGLNGATGVALAEVYEVPGGNAELINISTRALVGTGSSVEIAGIVVTGSQPATVLVRAVGPTLGQFGVSGTLAQPSLSVVDSAGNSVASNTGWSNNPNAATIATVTLAVGAFALPSGSADCALIVALPPGTYTAVVSGVNGASGIALVEAYQAPPVSGLQSQGSAKGPAARSLQLSRRGTMGLLQSNAEWIGRPDH